MSITGLDQRLRARRDVLEARAAPRRRLQHRVRRRVQRPELAQLPLPDRLHGPGQLRVFGKSNEKYHVRGGNDQIPTLLANALPEADQARLAADARSRRTRTAATRCPSSRATRRTPSPPTGSCWRSRSRCCRSVDYSKAGFSQVKKTAIAELPMGTNSKLHVQFNSRHWNTLGNNGNHVRRHRLPEHLGGDPRPAGHLRDSGRLHRREHRRQLRQRHADLAGAAVPRQIEPSCRASRWPSTIDTGGIPGRSLLYWKVGQYTKFSAPRASRRARCTSAVSTPRRTSRAT